MRHKSSYQGLARPGQWANINVELWSRLMASLERLGQPEERFGPAGVQRQAADAFDSRAIDALPLNATLIGRREPAIVERAVQQARESQALAEIAAARASVRIAAGRIPWDAAPSAFRRLPARGGDAARWRRGPSSGSGISIRTRRRQRRRLSSRAWRMLRAWPARAGPSPRSLRRQSADCAGGPAANSACSPAPERTRRDQRQVQQPSLGRIEILPCLMQPVEGRLKLLACGRHVCLAEPLRLPPTGPSSTHSRRGCSCSGACGSAISTRKWQNPRARKSAAKAGSHRGRVAVIEPLEGRGQHLVAAVQVP